MTTLDDLAKPPPPPSELDELMSRDPLELSAQDIDKIIAYQRQQRAKREQGGGRTKRPKAEPGSVSISLASLGIKTTPVPPVISKPSSGFRRL
jgi:hypothetical protein